MGDRAMYRFMNDNLALESHPVNYVNDPGVIAQNDNMISVNSTVEMDLTGACNSEHVNGHQFSAAGGQLDFVRGAYASPGGKSVIAFASTTRGGTISKVVPRLSGPVTTHDEVHYVATEYDIVNLKGLSSTDRAIALIGLAHPDYRGWLTDAARSNISIWRASNGSTALSIPWRHIQSLRDADQHLTSDRRSRRSATTTIPVCRFAIPDGPRFCSVSKIRRDQRQIVNDHESHRSLAVSS